MDSEDIFAIMTIVGWVGGATFMPIYLAGFYFGLLSDGVLEIAWWAALCFMILFCIGGAMSS